MHRSLQIAAALCLVLAGIVSCRAVAAETENAPVSIAVIYYSQSGNTRRMAETIVDGAKRVANVDARAFPLDDIDKEYVVGSRCVIFGSPTYMAAMAPVMRQWFVESAKEYSLQGKIGGMFATANYHHGGTELVMQALATQMLVKGMLVYSGGGAFGPPIIHLGPAAFGGKLEESEELFLLYGERMAKTTVEMNK